MSTLDYTAPEHGARIPSTVPGRTAPRRTGSTLSGVISRLGLLATLACAPSKPSVDSKVMEEQTALCESGTPGQFKDAHGRVVQVPAKGIESLGIERDGTIRASFTPVPDGCLAGEKAARLPQELAKYQPIQRDWVVVHYEGGNSSRYHFSSPKNGQKSKSGSRTAPQTAPVSEKSERRTPAEGISASTGGGSSYRRRSGSTGGTLTEQPETMSTEPPCGQYAKDPSDFVFGRADIRICKGTKCDPQTNGTHFEYDLHEYSLQGVMCRIQQAGYKDCIGLTANGNNLWFNGTKCKKEGEITWTKGF
jgi:hypothetical protein